MLSTRRFLGYSTVAAAALGLSACTALLGDFAVQDSPGLPDGGPVADASSDADCNEIGNRCEALDTIRCRAFLSGMTTQGRLAMKACMLSNCSVGLFECARSASSGD